MKKIYRRPIKQMPQWGVWISPMIGMFVIFIIGFACITPTGFKLYASIFLPAIALISVARGIKLFYNQYYIEVWDDRIVFVHVIRQAIRKEFFFDDIVNCSLKAYRGLDRTYGIVIQTKHGDKYRYLIDNIAPKDFREITKGLQHTGILVITEFKDENNKKEETSDRKG